MDCDAVAHEEDIDGPLICLYGADVGFVKFEPCIATEEACARDDRPELREVLIAFAAGASVVVVAVVIFFVVLTVVEVRRSWSSRRAGSVVA